MPSGAARALVLRLPPAGEGLFPAYDLSLQVDRQEALRAVGIPTASARFVADPAWVGAPFMVMPRVPGAVLATNPSYLRAGWLVDGGVERQQHVITAFLTTLGTLHRVPPTAVGAPPEPLVATLDRWCAYLDWAATGGAVPDYLARARDWCSERLPAIDATSSVLWGDVQLANCVFARHRRRRGAARLRAHRLGTGRGRPRLVPRPARHDGRDERSRSARLR